MSGSPVQRRLGTLTRRLSQLRTEASAGAVELGDRLEVAVADAAGVLEELREIAHGLHPAILTNSGLGPALSALARRSPVPVSLDVQVPDRLPEAIEIAAYYAVAEALTNTAKHARAATVAVEIAAGDGALRLLVSDNGRGGANFDQGSGLSGLRDRTEAIGGKLELDSPPGAGTIIRIRIPLADRA